MKGLEYLVLISAILPRQCRNLGEGRGGRNTDTAALYNDHSSYWGRWGALGECSGREGPGATAQGQGGGG